MTFRAGTSLFFAAVLAIQLPARADAHDDARRRYQQGVSAFEKGDFSKAVEDFGAVYQSTRETKHLWNLALAEYKAGRPYDALVHLREYVAKADANPKNVERAHGLISEVSASVGHVTVVAPAGASVLLDGASIGTAPLAAPLDVDPAKPHVIIAQRGADTVKQSLTPTGANSVNVELSFPVVAPAAPVIAAPAAPSASSPVAAAPQEPPPGASMAPAETTRSDGSAVRTWLTVGLGVGALAAVGGGVAMGLASNSDANQAQQLRSGMAPGACVNPSAPGCAALSSAASSATSDHTAAVILYSGAGVLAAGALAAFLFLPHGQPSDTRGALVPVVTPNGFGAGYAGVF